MVQVNWMPSRWGVGRTDQGDLHAGRWAAARAGVLLGRAVGDEDRVTDRQFGLGAGVVVIHDH